MNEESILEAPFRHYDECLIETIDVGCEIMKWLWRPVTQIASNIKIGTALVEYSLVRNILLKVGNDVAFVQRQCYPESLNVSIDNLQAISSKPKTKDRYAVDGQLCLFQDLKDTFKTIEFPKLYVENLGYHIEFAA
jgi:hypothetical protein